VVWTGLDSTKLNYLWGDDDTTLVCTYTGGLPANAITWSLNPVAGAANNLRGKNGIELAAATYRGSFKVQGSAGAPCDNATPVENVDFGIFKQVRYIQNDAGAPVNDPNNGAMIFSFASIPNAAGRAAIEFPADPAPLPHQLKFFGQILPGFEILTNSYATRADLDEAFPAGDYDFQLRNPPTVVVAHVVLSLSANGYPPIPHFANHDAAQAIATNTDFVLSWDAFTGATTNDAIQLQITDSDGGVIFSAPDTCANILLPATATSISIPHAKLEGGKTYTAELTFDHLNDYGKMMSGTISKGLAALSRVTRMTLRTAGGLPPATAPSLRNIALLPTGDLSITVEAVLGRPFTLESTVQLGQPFTTFMTTNPVVSPFTITIPPVGSGAFLRGRTD
jgi:hypothetical protein